MSLTVPEFWSVAEKSRLLPGRACADLRDRWQALKGAERATSARTLAEWLVAEGELTRYQARLLLAGQPGPFYYGEYLVTKRLHRGRLEDCFQAVHAPTRSPVTLRFVCGTAFEPTTDVNEIRRVFEEAPRADGVLVPFCEWVDCGAYQFGVFGRLEGGPVSDLVAEQGKLDVAAACKVVREAALGIAPLHVAGVPHGAVRPESIWLTEESRVSVLPRQLCERWDSLRGQKTWLTAGGDPAAITVVQFTAPEAAGRSAAGTPTADVYSLGCVLYLLLSGRPPFSGKDVAEILQQHSSEPPPLLSRRSVPDSLRRVVERTLMKDPSQRFVDSRQLAEALAGLRGIAPPIRAGRPGGADGRDAARRSAYLDWIARRPAAPSHTLRNSVDRAQPLPAAVAASADPKPLPVAKPLEGAAGADVPPAAPTAGFASLRPEAPAFHAAPPVSSRIARKRRLDWTAVGISLLVAAIAAGGVLLWHMSQNRTPQADGGGLDASRRDRSTPGSPAAIDGGAATGAAEPGPAPREQRVADDGRTLWASPTSGSPVSAAFLPAGTQGILSVRPADLLANRQGEHVLASFGPRLAAVLDELPEVTGFAADEIAHLIVGWRAGEPVSESNVFLVLRPLGGERLSHADLQQRIEGVSEVRFEGHAALLRGETAYYPTVAEGGPVLVICPAADLAEIASRPGTPPLLQREMEQLLAASDAQRHITLLLPPRLLLGDGRDFLAHHAAVLRDPLHWFVGEKTQAVLVSGHWGENFFLELQAIAAADVPPWDLREALEERLAELPTRVGDHVLTADLRPYGLRVVGRLPEMLRRLVGYTRSAVEGDRAVLRCYLPAPAGHNLLLASEILLAETHTAGGPASPAPAGTPQLVEERLAKVTSLSFSRDTLEAALEILADDVGVPIEIRGSDLQAEGITKNQSFAIEVQDRAAREILVEILRLANPDKTATSANDPRQKLIFTIEPDESGTDTVNVTTRKAAEQRGATLPPEFAAPR